MLEMLMMLPPSPAAIRAPTRALSRNGPLKFTPTTLSKRSSLVARVEGASGDMPASSLGTAASCALTLGVLSVVVGWGAQDVGDRGVLVTAYHTLVGLGVLGVLLWLSLALYVTRAAWVQWKLLGAGDFAGLTELGERAVEIRRLLKETAADRAWIAAQVPRAFASQQEAEAVLREIRSREQQIEQRQAKLASLMKRM